MCEKLVQEYRIWLEELLEILQVLCEDVVPAGRLDENVQQRTKMLWREIKCMKMEEKYTELLQYAADGRQLTGAVLDFCKVLKLECQNEEVIIRLRRKYSKAILNSMQMLVNYSYLMGACLQDKSEWSFEISKYFEIDGGEEVKRIRSGVMVERDCFIATVKTDVRFAISDRFEFRKIS